MKKLNVYAAIVAIGSASVGISSPSLAKIDQQRVVRIVVPFPPGGVTDTIARALAPVLGTGLGTTVIIENRAGASGTTAVASVLRAKADGHTLVLGSPGSMAIYVHLTQVSYDPIKDLVPISKIANTPFMLAVNHALPVRSIDELIAYAKANPTLLNYSSSGAGSTPLLAAELLKKMAGINMVHVPFPGTLPAAVAIASGQVQLGISDLVSLKPLSESGRLHMIATVQSKRSSLMPNLPTVAETGFPGFSADAWVAMFASADTPSDTVAQLNSEMVKALQSEEIRKVFAALGLEPEPTTPAEMASIVQSENHKWGQLIKELGINRQ